MSKDQHFLGEHDNLDHYIMIDDLKIITLLLYSTSLHVFKNNVLSLLLDVLSLKKKFKLTQKTINHCKI